MNRAEQPNWLGTTTIFARATLIVPAYDLDKLEDPFEFAGRRWFVITWKKIQRGPDRGKLRVEARCASEKKP